MDFEERASLIGETTADTHMDDFSIVELEKGNGGLGFNVVGGSDAPHLPGVDSPFVSAVRPFSPAYVDGKINVGDRIVSVNGIQLQNMTHDEIVEEFRKAGKKVTIVLDTGAEMRIVTEISMTKSLLEQNAAVRTAEYVNTVQKSSSIPNDPSAAQQKMDVKEVAPSEVKEAEAKETMKSSSMFTSAVCLSVAVAIGAAAVVLMKVVRHST